MNLSEDFWDNRYKINDIGWDLGEISPPLKLYIDQLKNKSIRILIPGGGNSYEAEYLWNQGFKNVYVVDISKTALDNIKKRASNFPSEHLIHLNFFELNMTFDLILEQTFFCALHPKLRSSYVLKTHDLLSSDGKLVGLLFNVTLYSDRPPFGGHKNIYVELFRDIFQIEIMEDCYNSMPDRMSKELFFKMKPIANV